MPLSYSQIILIERVDKSVLIPSHSEGTELALGVLMVVLTSVNRNRGMRYGAFSLGLQVNLL
jgi:hypothetical protein